MIELFADADSPITVIALTLPFAPLLLVNVAWWVRTLPSERDLVLHAVCANGCGMVPVVGEIRQAGDFDWLRELTPGALQAAIEARCPDVVGFEHSTPA